LATFVPTLKKLLSILILSAILLPSLGTWAWFKLQQQELRKEVRQSLFNKNKGDLALLVFSEEAFASKLRWENDWEFEYEGSLYDIATHEIKAGTHYLWCWKDFKEMNLHDQMEELLAKSSTNDTQNSKQVKLSPFFPLFYQNYISWGLKGVQEQESQNQFGHHSLYPSIPQKPLSPPPILI